MTGAGGDSERTEGQPRLTRRRALAAGAATAAAVSLPVNRAALARDRRKPLAKDGSFEWGVASGFPMPRGIVLWTRVGELDRSSKLILEVATDEDFRKVVHRDRVTAKKGRDFTVHAKVRRLKPHTEYFYRFHTRNSHSRVGRFRTAPPHDSDEQVRIGFFSCQNWQAGYFTAHGALADERDLDLVICLGDYIYENGTYPGPRTDTTGVNGDGDCQTLDEYRQKYRLYQSDPLLQEMHAAHPFVCIWDDHEVEDNYAGNKASSAAEEGKTNPGEPRRVTIAERQANGYKTFFDAMPRLRRKGDPNRIYGRARLGQMADLFMLDQRQYRDQQPCGDGFAQPCPTSGDAGRAYLGRTQMDWVKRSLERSGARWRLLGNQLMVMAFDIAPGQPVTVDSWEGYGAERRELMGHIADREIGNVVALTGDIHTFFAGTMTTTGRIDGTPAGVELVGGSITSLGVKETLAGLPVEQIEAAIRANNPHMIYADFDRRGYGVISLNKRDAICEYKAPETALEPGAPVSRLASFRIPSGSTSLEQLS